MYNAYYASHSFKCAANFHIGAHECRPGTIEVKWLAKGTQLLKAGPRNGTVVSGHTLPTILTNQMTTC